MLTHVYEWKAYIAQEEMDLLSSSSLQGSLNIIGVQSIPVTKKNNLIEQLNT